MKRISLASLMIPMVLAAFTLQAPIARAEKMDAETHTIVIEKMEQVLSEGREDETLRLYPIRARLADLYAERARLRSMDEAEKNCQDCTGSLDDRKRALALYEQVVKVAPKDKRGPVFIQMAHLYEIIGQPQKAVQVYQGMIRAGEREHGRKLVAEAYAGLAEAQFAKADFRSALKNFQTSVRLSEPNKRGYLTYRVAWSQLNLGNQPAAVNTLVRILRSPQLLTRDSSQGPIFDESFQEDASRDLATFLCRGDVGPRDIRLLESLTPARAKRDNLHHLATECERLGNKHAALVAWAEFLENETNPTDRLEALVRVAQIRFDLGQKPQALQNMKKGVDEWKKRGCKDENACLPLRMRLRKIVIDWNRTEKKKPTRTLLDAYQAYLSKFDDDVEMTAWAALVARETKQNRSAASLYYQASVLAHASLKGKRPLNPVEKEFTAKDAKETQEILEGSLVGAIEMAELAKDAKLRQTAYDHYLELNPNGKMAMKVRYQRGHLAYEQGNHKLAVSRFDEFVSSNECQAAQRAKKSEGAELCVQAADLALDSLVLLKNEPELEKSALKFASLVPTRRIEYLKIARKSALNQVAKTTNDPKSSTSELNKALEKLGTVNLAGATKDEQIIYWKNRLMLAEKAKNLDETDRSANGLLGVRGLSAQDREFGLSRKAWVAEMRLDFKRAYQISKNLAMPELSKEDRLLRLALLAELAGSNPRVHENQYLALRPRGLRAALLRANIVRKARSPMAEMRRQESELQKTPSVYAPLALEIFARTKDTRFAEKAIKVRGVLREPAGQELARHLFLKDFDALRVRLARHKIRSSSDALLGRTLGDRVAMLDQAEQAAAQAVRTGDWTLQLVTLSVLATENKRLHGDIMSLPVPKKLKGAQRDAYSKQVAARARPFLNKAEQIQKKLEAFWGNDSQFDAIAGDYKKAPREFKPVLSKDLRLIAQLAPSGPRRTLERALSASDDLPSQREIVAAREDVKESPFSVGRLKELKELEEKRGQVAMVTYLDARLDSLNDGNKARR